MASETELQLNALTIPNLKNILKNHKLPVSGIKSVLIKRIIKHIPTASIFDQNIDNHVVQASIPKDEYKIKKLADSKIVELLDHPKYVDYRQNMIDILNNNTKSIFLNGHQGNISIFNNIMRLLSTNTSIKKINIEQFPLSEQSGRLLGSVLIHNKIKYLGITSCTRSYTMFQPWIKTFGNSLRINHTLKYLNIIDCRLNSLGEDESIIKAITNNKSIKHLTLRNIYVDDYKFEEEQLSNMLLNNKTITSLSLINSGCGGGCKYFLESLSSYTALRTFCFCNLFCMQEDIYCLISALKNNSSIDKFVFSSNIINFDLWKQLIDVLSNKKMKSLSLFESYLSDDDIIYLCDRYVDIDIEALSFKNITLSSTSIDHLSKKLLANNIYVRNLELSYNRFDDDDIKILFNAMVGNKNIKNLNISHSYSGYINSTTILDIIKENFIEKLDISTSRFIGGLSGIGEVLSENYTLKELSLEGLHITDNIAQQIFIGLQNNDTLAALNLNDNPISKNLLDNINNIVEKNRLTSRSLTYMLLNEL